MKVCYCIPTARPELAGETFAKWLDRGYLTAALIDGDAPEPRNACHLLRVGKYQGYAASINLLTAHVAETCNPDWFVIGGDDQTPDPVKDAATIAEECSEHFAGTFGVMQPVGDLFGALSNRSAIVSPWFGRDWRRRMYGGKGPLCPEYFHYYEDAEHMWIAHQLGRLWWREDLTHFHDHFSRRGEDIPDHLKDKARHGDISRDLFMMRRSANFPGHEPIA